MVDVKKNEASMKEAWREVTDANSDTDWALFGYEGQTNVLKLISKGEDGVEELTEDLNPSRIMYGFLRVEDPKTSLPKYVILNWQGETAPGSRKGACAMHLRDIERFLAGHHLTVNVRNEDEIDLDSIIKKVSEITGSAYNFKAKPQGMEHSPEPVGTAHKKINPMQELPDMSEREKFWTKDQEEEKRRVVQEREKRSTESKKTEEERKAREEKEHRAREDQIKERERKISQLKDREKEREEKEKLLDKEKWEKQQEEDMQAARERSQRSERMRQERTKEAQELIKQRAADAKKIFTRNSSQGQMNIARIPSNSAPPPLPVGARPDDKSSTTAAAPLPTTVPEPDTPPRDHCLEQDLQLAPPPPGFQEENETPNGSSNHVVEEKEEVHLATPALVDKDDEKESSLKSYGICAVSLYDYQASDETEISFDPGQIITHIDQIDPGWWQGLGPDGVYGLFPANYVEVIDSSELQIQD